MKKLILALDVKEEKKALEFVDRVFEYVDIYKVGPILFLNSGPQIIKKIKDKGKEVFLDLKFHDIPKTVEKSVESARDLGVYSLTIHSEGGQEMIKCATDVSPRPKIWAVTVLTSQNATPEMVNERAVMAKQSGADGVIASAYEIETIRKSCGKDFTIVTPGIRLDDNKDDQQRVASPEDAHKLGSDFIVVGRAILKAQDPSNVAKQISEQINESK